MFDDIIPKADGGPGGKDGVCWRINRNTKLWRWPASPGEWDLRISLGEDSVVITITRLQAASLLLGLAKERAPSD
jgi:hypothetical protein